MAVVRSWVWDTLGFQGPGGKRFGLFAFLVAAAASALAVQLARTVDPWEKLLVFFILVMPLLLLTMPLSMLVWKLGFVRVGVDRVRRFGLRSFDVRMSEIQRFRYTSTGVWFIETARGVFTLGGGKRGKALVDAIYAEWPHRPLPSPTLIEAAQRGGFRGQAVEREDLAEMLRLPNLPDSQRVRIAQIVAHDEGGKELVEEVADACIDEGLKRRLQATVKDPVV